MTFPKFAFLVLTLLFLLPAASAGICGGIDIPGCTQKSGTYAADEIWSGTIYVSDNVYFSGSTNLTILPGTIIKSTDWSTIYIFGSNTLGPQAGMHGINGEEGNEIIFTSCRDQTVGENLSDIINCDGSLTGMGLGFSFNSDDQDAHFSHLVFRGSYTGFSVAYGAEIGSVHDNVFENITQGIHFETFGMAMPTFSTGGIYNNKFLNDFSRRSLTTNRCLFNENVAIVGGVYNNIFENCYIGIYNQANSNVSIDSVTNNTFVGSGYAGLYPKSSNPISSVENNIFSGNVRGIYNNGGAISAINHNAYHNNGTDVINVSKGANSIDLAVSPFVGFGAMPYLLNGVDPGGFDLIDVGSGPSSGYSLNTKTTDQTLCRDADTVDIGYHYPTTNPSSCVIVAGCPDGTCAVGENCPGDVGDCVEPVACQIEACTFGCTTTNIPFREEDNLGVNVCNSTTTAGSCVDPPCVCDGLGDCIDEPCPDGTCGVGENCPADVIDPLCTAAAPICFEPTCDNGCGQVPVPFGQTDGACTAIAGCATPPCMCNGIDSCISDPVPAWARCTDNEVVIGDEDYLLISFQAWAGWPLNFYDTLYDNVVIHNNGAITFDHGAPNVGAEGGYENLYEIYSGTSPFSDFKIIAPLWTDFGDVTLYSCTGPGYAVLRWDGVLYGNSIEEEFAVKIYQNGDMEFVYINVNDGLAAGAQEFVIGVSNGNGVDYQLLKDPIDLTKPTINYSVSTSAVANDPPIAVHGGLYSITLPATQVVLDGSGSTDPEDCDTAPCPGLTYAWNITNIAPANCSPTSPGGVTPTVVCSEAGTSNVTLTVTDSLGAQNNSSTTITVLPAGFVANDFEIVSIDVTPKNLLVVSGDTGTVSVAVEVRNITGGSASAWVDIEVFDLLGASMAFVSINPKEVSGVPVTFDSGPIVVGTATWPNGTYLVRVKVIDPSSGEVQGTSEKFFTLTTDPAATTFVPELDFVVLPILALAVLAVLFFRGKEKC